MARKMTEWPSEQRPFKKNQDIVWLQRRWNSLGGGSVVQFPWMSYGKCRLYVLDIVISLPPLFHSV